MNSFKNKQHGSALTNLIGGIAILGVSIFLVAKLANSGYTADVADTTESAIATRIMPTGSLKIGDGTEPGQRTGKQVYEKVCLQCHAPDSTTAFSPKYTNNTEWAPRIAKGLDALFNSAINGFQGQGNMPAKGGQMDLTDDEVKRAVVFMANGSGGTFPEPAMGQSAVPAAASAATGGNQAKANFEQSCQVCHGAGSTVPFAPKLGNKEDWAPRIAQGKETLFKHAINGFTGASGGVMPPKGGADYSDNEVKAIVLYMANEGGAKF